MTPQVSIIIATFNRAEQLRYVVQQLESQQAISELSTELVLVDNNSTDHTPEVLKSYKQSSRLPVTIVRETKQGSNHARNAGIQNAKGQILIFTDDDVEFTKTWLSDFVGYMYLHPECNIATGKVTPKFENAEPPWLTDELLPYYGHQDYGNAAIDLCFPKFPVEMNMAIRASVFSRYGTFSPAISRNDKTLMSNDAKLFFCHLAKAGETVRYIPNAHLYHLIPKERATADWILRRVFWQGVSDVAFDVIMNQEGATRTSRKDIADMIRLGNHIRGPHFSPRRIYWRWHGIPLDAKVWYAYNFGKLSRKIGLK
jgi:glycosyltransferase involved in cell wall biosynthesis